MQDKDGRFMLAMAAMAIAVSTVLAIGMSGLFKVFNDIFVSLQ